jgi:hypothetical protein
MFSVHDVALNMTTILDTAYHFQFFLNTVFWKPDLFHFIKYKEAMVPIHFG